MGKKGSDKMPLSVILVGATFLFLVLFVMMIPVLPFQVSSEEQTVIYMIVFVLMGGLMLLLMKNAKVF